MAKAKTSTTSKAAVKAPASFDEKANEQKIAAEAAARAAGKTVDETRHIVAPGHTLRKGGKFYHAGEAIDLSAADAERFLFKGRVLAADSKEGKAAREAKEAQIEAAKAAGATGELQQ